MIVLDMQKFTKSIIALQEENQKAVKEALYKTGVAIVNKAEPMVPVLEGNLVGSVSITVGTNVKLFQPTAKGKKPEQPNNPPTQNALPDELRVSYNMPYAYRLHEFPFNPGPVSRQKGLTRPGYKWLNRAIAQLNIPELIKRFYIIKKVIQ